MAKKRALVVGGTRGIGAAIAAGLAAEGCDIAVCGRSAEGVAKVIRALPGRAFGGVVDVRDREATERWVSQAASDLGGIDVLVWGVSAQSRDWIETVETDLLACVRTVDAALPFLRASSAGCVLGIASQAALLAVPGHKAYAAAKAALVSYFSSLARELAPAGVRVNVLSPGEILSDGTIWDKIRATRPQRYDEAVRKNIRGRLGTAEEVARVAVFLCSPAAEWICGAHVLVDGMGRDFVQF